MCSIVKVSQAIFFSLSVSYIQFRFALDGIDSGFTYIYHVIWKATANSSSTLIYQDKMEFIYVIVIVIMARESSQVLARYAKHIRLILEEKSDLSLIVVISDLFLRISSTA